VTVTQLWGYRDVDLTFQGDVNILIGPNGSGKTTILNLLRFILTLDVEGLQSIPFAEVRLHLRAFEGSAQRSLQVSRNADGLVYKLSNRPYTIPFETRALEAENLFPYAARDAGRSSRYLRGLQGGETFQLLKKLKELVPAVWLPVSRRLPIALSTDATRRGRDLELDSVDIRLHELLGALTSYRLGLNAGLSDRYSRFERDVLATILYSKEYDRLTLKARDRPSEADKAQLVRAFGSVGLLDDATRARIDEHFAAAGEAFDRLTRRDGPRDAVANANDLLVIPLISRTKRIIEFARDMEKYRNQLFTPLRRFEEIANSFLVDKKVSVTDEGQFVIRAVDRTPEVNPQFLSSGEKQLVILLVQALLRADRPVVYVVDEPELSLHIEWQAKLLKAIVELAGRAQLIVATHAPEILDGFRDRVVRLG
jgi:energy-coupling factor transporter ATP-binding protein EcfA2